jgi:hypothetical protein
LAAATITRSRTSRVTPFTPASTRDTEAVETPASAATSLMVVAPVGLGDVFRSTDFIQGADCNRLQMGGKKFL